MTCTLRIWIAILLATSLVAGCDGETPVTDGGTSDGGAIDGAIDGDVEGTPPTVVATIPQDDASEVDPATSIRIVFSEPIADPAGGSITAEAGGTEIALGAHSYSADRRELTVSPSAPLPGNASIEVTVDGFEDADGVAMAAPHTFTFSTSDPFAPTVTSATPAEAATSVSIALTSIELEFSEAMNVALGVATLSGGPGTLGAPVWEGARVTFPVSGLAPETAYRVTLSGFADPAGNALDGAPYLGDGVLDFVTGADAAAPVVTEASPGEGQVGVPPSRTTRARIVFSEPMDETAGAAALELDGTATPLDASWAAGGTILILDVSGMLEVGLDYRITLTGFTDSAGNPLDETVYLVDGALDFSTGADELPPFVLYTSPAEASTGVRWTTNSIFVTFSKPMSTTRTSVPFGDGEITSFFDATWSSGGTLLEIDVTGRLLSGRTYTLDLASFLDAEGAPLDATHPYLGDGRLTFTTTTPQGENCQDALTNAESTATTGGGRRWTIASTQVANIDGAAPCDASGGSADAVVRYTKSTPDSSHATGAGRVLRITVTSGSTVTDRNLNVDVLRDGCDPTSSVVTRLECRTGGNPHTIELDVPPGDYYVWVGASAATFRGATIEIEEVPAGLGDTCRNAIPITVGTTAITPSGTQSLQAPSCAAGTPLTWYRYTAAQRLALVTVGRTVGAVEAATGQHLLCRGEAATTPMPVVVEVGDDVCLAVASGAASSITITERPSYTGVRGVPTELGVTYPTGITSAPTSPSIALTPTRMYVSSGSGGGTSLSYLHAPRTGGVEAVRVTPPAADRVPGYAVVTIGEALYTVARNTFSSTTTQPIVLQIVDSTGAALEPAVAIDTSRTLAANTAMGGMVIDGSNFLVVQGSGTLTTAVHFYSVPIAGGPATHLGTNGLLRSVSAIAADAMFVYVISRTAGGGEESEGIYRLRRDDLANSEQTPVLVYGGGENWSDSAGGLFLETVGTTQWMYFRTYGPAHVHLLLDPGSASPLYAGPIWTTPTNNQTGLGYDPSVPALFLIDHGNGDAWVRLD